MFEIGFPELILIAIVGLLVIGPERLPEALRTLGLWIGRMRRSFTNVKTEIEKEIGMDEIRRQLHNEAVMEEMKRIERDVRDSVRAGETGKASNRAAAKQPGSDAGRIESSSTDEEPPSLEPHPSAQKAEPSKSAAQTTGPDAPADEAATPDGESERDTASETSSPGDADTRRHG